MVRKAQANGPMPSLIVTCMYNDRPEPLTSDKNTHLQLNKQKIELTSTFLASMGIPICEIASESAYSHNLTLD